MAREIVKSVKNAVLYSDGCIRIDNVRASYPHVDLPWSKTELDAQSGKPARKKYSITGLGDKVTHGEVKDLCVEVINKLLLDNKMGKIGSEHKFIRDGDNSGKDEAEGMWLFKASENADKAPSVRDVTGRKLTDPSEIAKTIYPGCYVDILIRPWAQNNEHGKKTNANLIAVKFREIGERFGEAPIDDEDVFGGGDEVGDDDL